ncbi:hypothetical protein L210DRAFT_3590865 [Boletus edulis BED1]|uniref:Uncharacterized protein n=1 Tax=Boletus edulis BED1 TaxID=1328754 RepID=A0AAD4B9N2_BOLED|nr:hypothetical protein L210DRAFT_3590865 [Boletus edulis BED1]
MQDKAESTCVSHGPSVVFTELSATYPLKLLSPKLAQDAVAIVYVLSYGGDVNVKDGCKLVLLSQVTVIDLLGSHHVDVPHS